MRLYSRGLNKKNPSDEEIESLKKIGEEIQKTSGEIDEVRDELLGLNEKKLATWKVGLLAVGLITVFLVSKAYSESKS